MPPLIDIGLNLTHDSFDKDRAEVLQRATDAGMVAAILTGSTAECSRHALELARTKPGLLFSTSGVHPHHAVDCDDSTIASLRDIASAPEVVAIGECGLDFFRNYSPPEVQEKWLIQMTLHPILCLLSLSACRSAGRLMGTWPQSSLPQKQ